MPIYNQSEEECPRGQMWILKCNWAWVTGMLKVSCAFLQFLFTHLEECITGDSHKPGISLAASKIWVHFLNQPCCVDGRSFSWLQTCFRDNATVGHSFCLVSSRECWCHILSTAWAPFRWGDNADTGLHFRLVLEMLIIQRAGEVLLILI